MPRSSALMRHSTNVPFAILDFARSGTGAHYFVDSVTGLATNNGQTIDYPVATIQQAINLCTANQSDHIWVMPGHEETLTAAGGITCNVAGITIHGLGNGTNRPTITLGTVVGCDVNVTAANVTITNLRFISAIDSLVNFLDLDAGNFTCEDCEFITASTLEAVCFADIATTFDDFIFRRCKFRQPTDPAGTDGNAGTGVFYFEDSENLLFEDCELNVNAETAIWHNKTTAAKNVWIKGCYGTQLLTGAEIFTQVAGMDGGILGSLLINRNGTDITEAQVTGALSANFFVGRDTGFGNDGGGGQLAMPIAVDAA